MAAFALVGIPVFWLWLGSPLWLLAIFFLGSTAIHLAVTPWLFQARVTKLKPEGDVPLRTLAASVELSLISLLFLYCLRLAWPSDIETNRFTTIAFTMIAICGVVAVVYLSLRLRRRNRPKNVAP
jgi:hypothetical protein